MKHTLLLLLCLFSIQLGLSGQTLHNPYELYDEAGGLFEVDSLREIHIDFYDDDFDDILQEAWYEESGIRLPATIELSNGIVLDSVAIRYKGNSTFAIPANDGNPKLPLNIDMNELVSGQKLMEYKKLKLANAMFDPSFCKEITGYNIYRRYLPSPEANFMKVYVQGDYWGLYINTESVNKQFLDKHFGEKDGVLFKCDPIQQFEQPGPQGNSSLEWLGNDSTAYENHYKLKSDHGWAELMTLIQTLDQNPAELKNVLNIDRTLWAFAVNTVVANLDTYNGLFQHNYYLYQTEDGLFQMIPWDVSESFVGALLNFVWSPQELYEYDPYNGYNSWYYPLAQALTSDSESFYGQLYTAHMRTILNESMELDAIEAYVDYLQEMAADAVQTDENKLFSMGQFYQNADQIVGQIAGINSTANLRKAFLMTHPEIEKTPPNISDLQENNQGGTVYISVEVNEANLVELMTTTSEYNSNFIATPMYDDGTNGDAQANDDIYTLALPNQNDGEPVKYYIRARNEEAIQLEPSRAEYQFYIFDQATPNENLTKTKMLHIHPNPIHQNTTFTYHLNNPSKVQLKIIDAKGQLVESLINEKQNTGTHQINWSPQSLPNGSYHYSLQIDDYTETDQLILVK